MNYTELAAILCNLAKFAGEPIEICVKGRRDTIVSAGIPYGAALPPGWAVVNEAKLNRIPGYIRVCYTKP